MKPSLCVLISLFLVGLTLPAAEPGPQAEATTPRPCIRTAAMVGGAWFGMFIHWGPVSLQGTEISWSRRTRTPSVRTRGGIPADVYDNLYRNFNPTQFDADQWVGIAKAAGAKYIVLTAKHCDGFLLWHSKASDYNISQTPFKRDICAELTQAARPRRPDRLVLFADGLARSGFPHRSQRGVPGSDAGGMRELLGNYGVIDLQWFDWDGHQPLYDQAATYQS